MSINLSDELKTDFLVYAQCVNNERAFPDARDGLKISQRAVLWEMFDKKYSSNKPHVKSAKVDGGVIANWHPHGSEYPTIVRMSQDWVNNIPEIDFHGANGSLIGGPDAAASRYTECRLSQAAEAGFFSAINKNQVDFIKNYSEDQSWPSVFPAIFPRLFINGSQGIGYTIAQEWDPGNLNEFVNKVKEFVGTGKLTCDDIYPDFPTGGIIINKSELKSIYETGKGSIVLRGKTAIEKNKILITELPYQTYAEAFIQQVKELSNAEKLAGVDDICNKSGDNGLLIEISCDKDPQIVLNQLFKLTSLQSTFSPNQMALVDGIPQLLNLKQYIEIYVNHNLECIRREYQFDLDKALARKEIVDGLIRAISIIDNIIATIKAAKSAELAKADIIGKFQFTENQAKAIIEMRLGKLANLEIEELNKELSELTKTINACEKLLNSEKNQQKELLKRLDVFAADYGWERRTQVIDLDVSAEKQAVREFQKANAERFIICMTKGGLLKRIPESAYKPQKVQTDNDQIIYALNLDIKDRFVIIGAKGMMYKLTANKIDLCNMNSAGMDISKIINDRVIGIFTEEQDAEELFLITKQGQGKKMLIKDVFQISKNIGSLIIKLADKDEVILCKILDTPKFEISFDGKINKIDTTKYSCKGRFAGGQNCIKIKKKQKIDLWS